MILNGFELYVDPARQVKTKRTWKERLFSTPWRPFASHNKEAVEVLLDGQVIQMGNKIVMNQKTYNRALKEMGEQNND